MGHEQLNVVSGSRTYLSATVAKVRLAKLERYAKSPLSIRIPFALYLSSSKAKATPTKFKSPLL